MLAHALSIALVVPPIASFVSVRAGQEADAPTVEAVLEVVNNWFADGGRDERARERLAAWGDSAVPAFRELAGRRHQRYSAFHFACALDDIDAAAAGALQAELLGGNRRALSNAVFGGISPFLLRHNAPRIVALRTHAAFEPAVVRYLDSRAGSLRAQAAEIVGVMRWEQHVDALRRLLGDPEFLVRAKSAEALRLVCGEVVALEPMPLGLDEGALLPGLLGEPRRCDPPSRRGGRHLWLFNWVGFAPWTDGVPALLVGNIYGIHRLDSSGEVREVRELPYAKGYSSSLHSRGFDVGTLHALPGAPGGVRTLVGGGEFHVEELLALGAQDELLWKFVPEDEGLLTCAVRYAEGGPCGVLVCTGGGGSLVALDLAGARDWTVPDVGLLDGLSTHPNLPGLFLRVGGEAELCRDGATGPEVLLRIDKDVVYAWEGVLCRDAQRRPALLLRGEKRIARFDVEGRLVWRIDTPTQVRDSAVLETDAGPLHAVVLEDRRLFVLDDAGRLLAATLLPLPEGRDEAYAVREVTAGRLADGTAIVVASGLSDLWLLEVDTSRLSATGSETGDASEPR